MHVKEPWPSIVVHMARRVVVCRAVTISREFERSQKRQASCKTLVAIGHNIPSNGGWKSAEQGQTIA